MWGLGALTLSTVKLLCITRSWPSIYMDPPYWWFCIQLWCSSIVFTTEKKSIYKWIGGVQNLYVQGSITLLYERGVNLLNSKTNIAKLSQFFKHSIIFSLSLDGHFCTCSIGRNNFKSEIFLVPQREHIERIIHIIYWTIIDFDALFFTN